MTTKTIKTTSRATKNDNATIVANVETNASNDDTTTIDANARATTRAIRDANFDTLKNVNVESTHAKFTKMSSGNIRIDHTNCTHATSGNEGKRDRAKCRNRVEKFIREMNDNA